jgi:mannose-6-phosphate isomerase-like protein (cupin superfamily)
MAATTAEPRYQIVDFAEIPGTPCPCGIARRAFSDAPASPGTFHVTQIEDDARIHYHRSHTETYYILECAPDAAIYLDGEVFRVRPGSCILIPPGVRHRAIGRMKIINVVFPKFDPADEHFD